MSVNAIIVNRNLLSSLENTVKFLRKESRVKEIHILDQASSYPPLLKWYKTAPETVHYVKSNDGPYSAWSDRYLNIRKDFFILADPDCDYEGVPDDWLDKMFNVLNKTDSFKVGFSLRINNLPNTEIGKSAYIHESKYWKNKTEYGWNADVDTTFALYRPNSPFSYSATRLDEPYCIKHIPWYLDEDNITNEWKYYLENSSTVSTWGTRLLNELKNPSK